MKYRDYSIEDFLKDDYFVQWTKENDPESNDFWEKWMNNNSDRVKILMAAKQILLSINYKNREHLDEEEYLELFENILKKNEKGVVPLDPFKKHHWFGVARLAATITFVISIGLGYLVLTQWTKNPDTLDQKEAKSFVTKKNPKGRMSTIRLGDGSIVRLGNESSIKFPEGFSSSERIVYLDKGEAFFKVIRDVNRPFIVIAGEVRTKVLGTSFNANYDSLSNTTRVALVTGEVLTEDAKGNFIVLHPGEMVTYSDYSIEKDIFQYDQVLGWIHNRLVFANADAEQVVNRLEKWYGVEFVLNEQHMFEGLYTGVFENETLENVLNGISYTSDFRYEIADKKVLIMK